jgi:hypothetical protein
MGDFHMLWDTTANTAVNVKKPPSNGFYGFAVVMGRQSAIYTENSRFASPALGRHISTFRGYQILFSIQNPYINRFTNHFSIHS